MNQVSGMQFLQQRRQVFVVVLHIWNFKNLGLCFGSLRADPVDSLVSQIPTGGPGTISGLSCPSFFPAHENCPALVPGILICPCQPPSRARSSASQSHQHMVPFSALQGTEFWSWTVVLWADLPTLQGPAPHVPCPPG